MPRMDPPFFLLFSIFREKDFSKDNFYIPSRVPFVVRNFRQFSRRIYISFSVWKNKGKETKLWSSMTIISKSFETRVKLESSVIHKS